ncbi:MAG: hypothetical protein IJB28_02675 [Bacteroidaceae bacterium]|nr:hypothetical protein [Bacteroidaceae bacterium]
MKLRNLLVLGALLLAGSASAAIQERQKPALPEPIDAFTDGVTSMYMYNVGAERFFCAGNSWGTQTSIGDEGYRVYFEQHVVDAEAGWDGTTVIFKDSCLAKSGALKEVFFDNVNGGCFVDRGSQANLYWKLQKNADNAYYRLSMAECNNDYQAWQVDAHPNTFWGWDAANGTVVSSFLDPNIETVHVDWGFCTVAAYDAYKAAIEVYNASLNLKALIVDAQSQGVDVSSLEAVYNNPSATVEDINAAIASYEELTVDPKNPIDKTSFIANPTMEDTSGWTSIDGVQNRATHTNVTTGAYTAETLPAYEHWNPGAFTGKFYQTITGLPNGLYKLQAAVMGDQEPAAEGTGLYLYANDSKTPVTSNIPAYYNVFAEVTDGTIEIGWTAEIKHSQWISSDSYSLLYYGNKGEATYAGAVAGLVNANLAQFEGREAEMTVGTIDTYKATLNGLAAADLAGLNAAIVAIADANAAVQANIDGWVKYAAEIERGNKVRNDNSYSSSAQMSAMAAYVARQAPAILKAKTLSTEELLAEVAKLTQMIEDAIRASLKVNSDVTDMFLVNARYDNGTTGWLGNWTAVNYGCMEAYAIEWDAYQIVKNAPQGVYEVSLQGFYRVERGDGAYTMWQNGQQTCPGHVYVNNHLNEVKCVFSEPVKHVDGEYIYSAIGTGPESNPNAFIGEDGDSIFFPNDMKTAGEAFTNGMYVSSANGLVAQQGDELRIGVKGKKQNATWVIWDNFKMIYRGKQIAYTLPYLQEAVAAAEVTLTQAMAKDTKELLEAAKANAESLLNSTDENAVFDALVQIYAANDSVAASADLFAELTAAAQEVQNAMMVYGDFATETAMAAAQDLLIQMLAGVEQSALTKDEAKALLAQKDKVIVDLIVGNWPDASDDNVMDYTALLSCPSFEDINGAGSAEGWKGADGTLNGDVKAYEFYIDITKRTKGFDLYQELKNIPNGTYRIEVSAYERIGSALNDYDIYKAGKDTATTYLYAGSDGDTIQTKVARLASGAFLSNDAFGIEGCTPVDTIFDETQTDTLMHVANTMASAVTMFADYGEYTNTYYVKVTDGTLRLGIKKEVVGDKDWIMIDNWKLYYHGTNSKDINEVISTGAPVVKRDIFTLGGAQVGKLQQGVNIIRNIHADGTVTVKKVIK